MEKELKKLLEDFNQNLCDFGKLFEDFNGNLHKLEELLNKFKS